MVNQRLDSDLNLIEELWLRRWARQHYTDPEHRVPNWHPVILDEMKKKDGERQSATPHHTGTHLVETTRVS